MCYTPSNFARKRIKSSREERNEKFWTDSFRCVDDVLATMWKAFPASYNVWIIFQKQWIH